LRQGSAASFFPPAVVKAAKKENEIEGGQALSFSAKGLADNQPPLCPAVKVIGEASLRSKPHPCLPGRRQK
jgi:hypothetical protein